MRKLIKSFLLIIVYVLLVFVVKRKNKILFALLFLY